MEKDRRIKKYSIMALIVALLGLTVVYAAITTTLNINATARANKIGINIVFEKVSGVTVSKSSRTIVTLDEPDLKQSGKVLDLGEITFSLPNDYYQYSINIVNKGQKAAKITGVEAPYISETALRYMDMSFRYENGLDVGVNDIIESGQSKRVIIRVALKDLSNEEYEAMPDDLVLNLNNLTISFEKYDGEIVSGDDTSSYSFTLNQLINLSSYNLDNGLVTVSESDFWSLIGSDLSQDDRYYTAMGDIKMYNMSTSNSDFKCATSVSDLSSTPDNELYLVELLFYTKDNLIGFGVVANNNGAWDLDNPPLKTDQTRDSFKLNYGDNIFSISILNNE